MREINSTGKNVMTIEDPVEYVFAGINQIQTNDAAGLSFAMGLKAILRQDPDVILVGEVRDADTARIAVQSALTGHLVLSSLHGTDSVAALHRMLDMGIESFLVASSVVAVVGQRLVRRICDACKEEYTPEPEELEFYLAEGGAAKSKFWHGAGCTFCAGTGYRDRIGIYELLRLTPELRRLIVGWATQEELRRLAVSAGHAHADAGGRSPWSRATSRPSARSSAPCTGAEEEPMPRFAYVAVDPTGATIEGARKGETIGDVRSWLKGNELYPVKIEERRRKLLDFEITSEKLKKRELMHFSRQLAVFIKAGIPIITALETIADEAGDKVLRRVIADMVERLGQGSTFADAAAAHPEAFPAYYTGVLRSAELTGKLDETVDSLAQYLDREIEARSKVISALVYPAIVMVMAVFTIVILRPDRAPAVQEAVRRARRRAAAVDPDAARHRPVVDRPLVHPGRHLRSPSRSSSCGCGRRDAGRHRRDEWVLRLPVIGGIIQYAILERFCRIMATMTVGRRAAARCARGHDRVDEEPRLQGAPDRGPPEDAARRRPRPPADRDRALPRRGPPDDQRRRGERHARPAARQLGAVLRRELEVRIKRFTNAFEPITIIFVGVGVGFVAVALVQAMYGMLGGLSE